MVIIIRTTDFTFSPQAKKLPEIIPINEEFAYILGLWKADRCSTAKGIVGLKNKDEELLEVFRNFVKKMKLEVKERIVKGYGVTKEVYCCSMPLRRIFEFVSSNRQKLLDDPNVILAYIAGLIDGDGSPLPTENIIRIFYDNKNDADTDSTILTRIGIPTRVTPDKKRKMVTLTIKNAERLASKLLPFIKLPRKINKLKLLAMVA